MQARRYLLSLIFSGSLLFGAAAQADMITATFTGDNVAFMGLCADEDCETGTLYAETPNSDDWRNADSIPLDLGPGTYYFFWQVDNTGIGSSRNPAGFLGEIVWGSNTHSSSSSWQVSTDRMSWTSATEYGLNGGSNIWTNNNGGNPISGISTSAYWLWTANNGNIEMDSTAYFRTSITVPEPGTLALLGLGLLGIGAAKRRRN